MPLVDLRGDYGPCALVAGASEGIGAAFARQVAAAGLDLVLVARRAGPLDRLAAELRGAHGVDCLTASIDLAAGDAAERMLEAAGGREIGLLVLNAGADWNGAAFLDGDLAQWTQLAMRNVVTVMRACHHFAAPMRGRGRGGIIIVGSGACYGGIPGIAVYGATKAFDLVFGEALWVELKPYGVDVLNLVIGRTDTPAHRELLERLGTPFPEDCADPEEVAALGLARLRHGPTVNWGEADDEPGMAAQSVAERRRRIEAIAGMAQGHTAASAA